MSGDSGRDRAHGRGVRRGVASAAAVALVLSLCAAAAPLRAADPPSAQRGELERVRAEFAALAGEPADAPLLEARKRAASRLITLLGQRGADAGAPVVADAPVAAALSGPPPHPTPELDRLRDQRDGLASQRAALAPVAASTQAELDAALAAQRRAQEALRLATERAGRAGDGEAARRERDALQLARLEARVAELEVARFDRARGDVRARLDALAAPLAQLDDRIARARFAQRIDERDVVAIRADVAAARTGIAGERARLETALERLAPGDPAAEREAASLRDTLAALVELDAVEAGRIDVWDQRRAALSSGPDAAARRAAATALDRSIAQAQAHRRAVASRIEVLESEARVRRARVDALREDAPQRAAEARAAAAVQRHLDVQARLRDTLERYATLLSRSRDDLGVDDAAPRSGRERIAAIGTRLVDAARAVWRYELFSATETVLVDGRTVTVDHGVTVGKSIGVLGLFVAGGWLAARVSRRAIGAAVASGRVGEQLGRVLHRWTMTVLLLAVMVVALKLARVPLTAFAFVGGALAIGVGFGTQNLIKNLISGVIILFERKIRVGDVVTLGGISGTVVAVDLRATTVRGFDGIDSILPNSHLLENQVSDWSHGAGRIRGTVLVPVAHGADAAAAAACVLECARAHEAVLGEPPPQVLFDDVAPAGPVFRLWYWFRLDGPRAGPLIASDLRFAIDRALRERGIAPARALHHVRIDAPGAPATGGG